MENNKEISEIIINQTDTLWSSRAVVHIQGFDNCYKREFNIEFDARQLLEDIPTLHLLCLQAIESEDEHTKERYKEFKKRL